MSVSPQTMGRWEAVIKEIVKGVFRSQESSEIVFATLISASPPVFQVSAKLFISDEKQNMSLPIADDVSLTGYNANGSINGEGASISQMNGYGTVGLRLGAEDVGKRYAFLKNLGGQTYHFLYRVK